MATITQESSPTRTRSRSTLHTTTILAKLDWTALSERSLETLQDIALPISLGRSNSEVAATLGKSEAWVAQRMRELRDEIRAQVDDGASL